MVLGDPPRNVKSKPAKLATPPHQYDVFTEDAGLAGGSGDGTPYSKGSSLPADFVVNLGYALSLLDCQFSFCIVSDKFYYPLWAELGLIPWMWMI